MTHPRPRWRDLDRRYLLEGALVAVVILGPSVAVALALDLGEGSIADWVAAVATVAAVLAAVYAGVQAAAVLAIERAREARADEDRRRAQASRIGVWGEFDVQRAFQTGRTRITVLNAELRVRNASEVPVTSMVISLTPIQVRRVADGRIVPVAQDPTGPTSSHALLVVPPTGTSMQVRVPLPLARTWVEDRSGVDPEALFGLYIEFEFLDASGVWWRRDRNGVLIEVDPPTE